MTGRTTTLPRRLRGEGRATEGCRTERKKVGEAEKAEKKRERGRGRKRSRHRRVGDGVEREPEGLSMVADSTSGPAGVWAAGIQVEAAANPKESSPWLPAPASTGLHADVAVAREHTHTRACVRRKYVRHMYAHRIILPSLSRELPFRYLRQPASYSASAETPKTYNVGERKVPPLTHFPLQLLRT